VCSIAHINVALLLLSSPLLLFSSFSSSLPLVLLLLLHTRACGISAAPDVVDQPNPHASSASGGEGKKKLTPDEMMAKVNKIT
jgi:hypothetical protein